MKKICLLIWTISAVMFCCEAQETRPIASEASVTFAVCSKTYGEDVELLINQFPYVWETEYGNHTFTIDDADQTIIVDFTKDDGCTHEIRVNVVAMLYPLGALNEKAVFSVSSTKQVYFSRGNLQYRASNGVAYSSTCESCLKHKCVDNTFKQGIWRFADHQWDYVGNADVGTVQSSDNLSMSASCTGWVDLFSYGTSGYNNYHPYNRASYYSAGNSNLLSTADGGTTNGPKYDWGYYNEIQLTIGENTYTADPGQWRVMTTSEWNYLISGSKRTNKWTRAQIYYDGVNAVSGLVLIPDAGVSSLSFTLNYGSNSFSNNVLTLSKWEELENQGAIFLPSCGYVRYDKYSSPYYSYQTAGNSYYWTSQYYSTDNRYRFNLPETGTISNSNSDYGVKGNFGCAVRLVQDVPTE